jgi:hypothetical protein
VVLWGLIVAYALLLAVPAVLFLRLPAPLVLPEDADAPAIEAQGRALRERLRRNRHLAGRPVGTPEEVAAAIRLLDGQADALTRATASRVFLTTAVSQNGKLDGLLVLGAQSRLVWQIAHLYWQRPNLRDMVRLYANVAGTAFVATELDDVQLAEQVAPIMTSALGGTVAAVPGLQGLAAVLTNSLLTGSANAFLTLRVGVISRRYCGALTPERRNLVRRAATHEAAVMLAAVARDNSIIVTSAVWDAFKGPVSQAFHKVRAGWSAAADGIGAARANLASRIGEAWDAIEARLRDGRVVAKVEAVEGVAADGVVEERRRSP